MSSGGVISHRESGWTWCHWKPGSCHGQMRTMNNPYERSADLLGTFVPIVPWADEQTAIRLIDWDHDGDLDAIGVKTNGSASFYEFIPKEEKFVEHPLLLEALPSDHRLDVEVADWDGDGDLDLIQCAWDTQSLVFFENLGNGSFAPHNLSVTFAEPERSLPFCFIQALDLDADGDVDLILNNHYFERISQDVMDELSGDRNPYYRILNRPQKYTERLVLADWDADGDLDALVFDYFEPCQGSGCTLGGWHFFERLLDGSFSEHQNWDNPFSEFSGGEPGRLQVVDWNGDGLPDFFYKQMHLYSQQHYMQKWTARLSAANPFQALNLDAGEPHFVDWNMDGQMDLLVATHQDIRYFERQRDGSLREKEGCFDNVTITLGMRLAAADWDSDGDMDLILVKPGGAMEYYDREGDSLLLQGNHSFAAIQASPEDWAPFVETLQPLVLDWDKDGDLDLILAPAGRLFRRDGDSLTEEPNSMLAYVAKIIMTCERCDKILAWKILDLDFDGHLDVLQIRSHRAYWLKQIRSLDDNLFTRFEAFRIDHSQEFFEEIDFWAPVNNDKAKFYSRGTSPMLDFTDWNGDGGYDVLEIDHQGQAFFWMGGFCKPDNACERHGVCQESTGTCACSPGYQLNDCSACDTGYFTEYATGHLSYACLPCSGAEVHEPCHKRGRCHDDEAAVQLAKQQNRSNTSAMSAKGTGQCSCTEPYFGGFTETGLLSCAHGSCPAGWQEVANPTDQAVHQCEPCLQGWRSKAGFPCEACPAGSIADQNRSECISCSPGHVAAFVASHECQACMAGSYANRNATACWPCGDNAISHHASARCLECEGFFFAWEADPNHESCQVAPMGIVSSLSFFACLLGVFWLLAFARVYILRITDLSIQAQKMVLSTHGRHCLKKWRQVSPPVQVLGTGVPPLEASIADVPFRVTPLHPEQLVLVHPDGRVGPWDTSMGEVHLKFPATLFYVRFLSAPLLFWLILLLCGSSVAVLLPFMPWPLVLISAVSAFLVFLLGKLWGWYRCEATPLAKRQNQFLQQCPKPQPCERGPLRALEVVQLEHFHEFFESFIRDRSMYYVYSNLVKPLTKEAQLSYAELVGASMVQWFVSHYWGMPFRHFWETVRKHSQQLAESNTSSEATYWVCTFSNNQWAVNEELGNGDVLDSSFYLSLRLGFSLAIFLCNFVVGFCWLLSGFCCLFTGPPASSLSMIQVTHLESQEEHKLPWHCHGA